MALKKKKITLEDLAMMVQRGFQEVAKQMGGTAKRVDVERGFRAVEKRFTAVDQRFDGIENRLVGVENHLVGVENRLVNIEFDVSYLKARVNEVDRKLDISQDEVDTRLTRLEKKVAIK